MMDLSDCVGLWATPIEVTRYYSSSRDKGRSIPPVGRTFTTMMTVEPMGRRESQLSEGDRNEGRVQAFGTEELKTVDTSECRIADEFEYKGVRYEIAMIDDWRLIGGYYRYEAVRKNR